MSFIWRAEMFRALAMRLPKKRDSVLWLIITLLSSMTSCATGYKPIFLVHGLSTNASDFDYLIKKIKERHNGTVTFATNAYSGDQSHTPLWEQINGNMGKEFLKFSKLYLDGFHLIGKSQGGLIARGLIETYFNHNVHTFISLAGPQGGTYGDVPDIPIDGHNLSQSIAYEVLYNNYSQNFYSQANIYRDPLHLSLYRKYNNFLPYIDNEIISKNSENFKWGFTNLSKIVLVGGPDDGLIVPWQSEIFGVLNERLTVVPFQKRRVFDEDSFGLRTLAERGAIDLCIKSGVKHADWQDNDRVIEDCVLPYLV